MLGMHPLADRRVSKVFPVLRYFESRKMSGEEMKAQLAKALRKRLEEQKAQIEHDESMSNQKVGSLGKLLSSLKRATNRLDFQGN